MVGNHTALLSLTKPLPQLESGPRTGGAVRVTDRLTGEVSWATQLLRSPITSSAADRSFAGVARVTVPASQKVSFRGLL